MGFRRPQEWRQLLLGSDADTIGPSGAPAAPPGEVGPFAFAFADSIRAERAAQGLSILRKFNDFDPEKNWVDSMEPARGDSFRFGANQEVYYADGSNALSGNRALKFPISFGEVDSPRFRIKGGYPYIHRLIYKSDGAAAQSAIAGMGLFTYSADQLTIIDSIFQFGSGVLGGTSGLWREEAWVITPSATAQWASFHVTGGTSGPGQENCVIDYLSLEPCPPSFFVFRNTTQSITGGAAAAMVTFDGVTADYGAQVSAGLFTCKYPGIYHFDTSIQLEAMADNQEIKVTIRIRGSDQAGVTTSAAGAGQHNGSACGWTGWMARGDTAEVRVFNGDTVARTIAISAANSFSGARIRI